MHILYTWHRARQAGQTPVLSGHVWLVMGGSRANRKESERIPCSVKENPES